MKTKLALIAVLGLFSALAWWLSRDMSPAEAELLPDGVPAELRGAGETVLERVDSDPQAVAAEELVPLAVETEAPAVAADDDSDPWKDGLGGVIGRVVEEDETPVVDVSIALVQVDANFLLAADWQELGEPIPELIVARTRTDDEGRFRLDGAYDGSFQGLGIDLRGPRSTVRVVEQQVHRGEWIDLGDVVLAAGCTITGRVLDGHGAPVEGARVRFVPAPAEGGEELLGFDVQDFRSDCAVGISTFVHRGESSPVVEPPPLVRRHLDDFPFPTARTDEEGRYRFEGAPIGRLFLAADMRGWLGTSRFQETVPGENELPDLALRVGRTISGVVMDLSGEPVVGVEVMAGTEIAGAAAILHPAGLTDAAGRFAVTGCPEAGNMMACARRRPGEPWVGVIGASVDEMEIELEEEFQVDVRVVDGTGQPVEDADVRLTPTHPANSPMHLARRFGSVGGERRPSRFQEVEPGLYRASDVTPGLYEVSARPRGLAFTSQTVDLWPGEDLLVLTCEPGRTLELSVIDAKTGLGVYAARASILSSDVDLFSALAVGRTDRKGTVRLGPFGTRVFDWEDGEWEEARRPARVLVQHPRYADATLEVPLGTSVAELALQPGGELVGQITWGANPPQRLYMLTLQPWGSREDVEEAFIVPRFARSGLDGSFRFTGLKPGTWRLEVHERWLDGDPLHSLMDEVRPVLVHRQGDLEIESGLTLSIQVDLSPDGGGQTARLAGTVRMDGRPLEGAEVSVAGAGARVDETGYYETQPFLCTGSEVRVWVRADLDGKRTVVYEDRIQPTVGAVYRLDVDVGSSQVYVAVADATDGAPVPDARVQVRVEGGGRSVSGNTGEDGELRLTVVGAGKAVVTVTAKGYSNLSRELEISPGDPSSPVLLELAGALPCSGICDLSAVAYGEADRAFVVIQGAGGFSEYVALDLDAPGGRAPFAVDGVGPGEYRAQFWIDGEMSEQIEFELPPEGAMDLELRHPGE